MNERVKTIAAWCLEQIGCPYIYGATGQACTPAYRRARIKDYPKYEGNITRNCPILSNRATSCAGCEWAVDGVGRLAYDCAQLTRSAMKQAGIALVSGANSQWQKTAFVCKGEIADMPQGLLCLIYREDDDGKKHHTGVYMGDGYVVHARGHDYGVVWEKLGKSRFTHFGVPAGLYSDQELRDAGIDPSGNVPTLRRVSTGELVKSVQEYLNYKIGAGLTVDGVFGSKTEEAVKAFQRAHGLTADGVVGPKTWAELGVLPDAPMEGPVGDPEEWDPPEEPDEPEPPGVWIALEDWRAIKAAFATVDSVLRKYE